MKLSEKMRQGSKVTIGMVHTLPLPGTLKNTNALEEIITQAVQDAKTLEAAGFDALIVENVSDMPYVGGMTHTQVAALTLVCAAVRQAVAIPMGIDACGDSLAGIEIGSLTGATFVRLPYFVDMRVTMDGMQQPCGGKALLLRKQLQADQIEFFADVQVKHSFGFIEAVPIEASAAWAASQGADALIVTGLSTGRETPLDTIRRVKSTVSLPVVVGSGLNAANAAAQYKVCDGAVVGSALKPGGNLFNPVDADMAASLMRAVRDDASGGGGR